MDRLLLDIPTRIETERLYLRCYQPGDGQWYYAMSKRTTRIFPAMSPIISS